MVNELRALQSGSRWNPYRGQYLALEPGQTYQPETPAELDWLLRDSPGGLEEIRPGPALAALEHPSHDLMVHGADITLGRPREKVSHASKLAARRVAEKQARDRAKAAR